MSAPTSPRTRAAGAQSTAAVPQRTSPFELLSKARSLGIVLALAVLVAVTFASNPRFLSGQSVRDIGLDTAILAVLAVGQTVVITTRSIDLSMA